MLLIVGEISAGYGLATDKVGSVCSQKDRGGRIDYRVVNASISGDTAAGGRARLPALLAQHKPAVVIVELGGNDALRGGKLATMRDNLDAMVSAAQAAGARVLIVGMEIPPNYGPAYAQEFKDAYTSVAKARKVPLVPSFFAGFGEDLAMFQPDRRLTQPHRRRRGCSTTCGRSCNRSCARDDRPRTRGFESRHPGAAPHTRSESTCAVRPSSPPITFPARSTSSRRDPGALRELGERPAALAAGVRHLGADRRHRALYLRERRGRCCSAPRFLWYTRRSCPSNTHYTGKKPWRA